MDYFKVGEIDIARAYQPGWPFSKVSKDLHLPGVSETHCAGILPIVLAMTEAQYPYVFRDVRRPAHVVPKLKISPGCPVRQRLLRADYRHLYDSPTPP
jgi:hypothetical protein